jgi:hypothetical protein
MPKATGAGQRVVAFVAANPGCAYAELCEGSGAARGGGLISYMASTGRIFMAGPHGCRRYYPTAEMAAAAHDDLVRLAAEARREVKRRADVEQLRRRKAVSRMLGKSRNTRPDRAVQGEPSATTFVVSGVRVRISKPDASTARGPKLHDKRDSMGRAGVMPTNIAAALRKPGSNARSHPAEKPARVEPITTSATRLTARPSGADHRYTVRELPPGYCSVLDPRECRPWAAVAAGSRAA